MRVITPEEEARAAKLAGAVAIGRGLRLSVSAIQTADGAEIRFGIAWSGAGRMVLTGPSGRHYWADTGEPCDAPVPAKGGD